MPKLDCNGEAGLRVGSLFAKLRHKGSTLSEMSNSQSKQQRTAELKRKPETSSGNAAAASLWAFPHLEG